MVRVAVVDDDAFSRGFVVAMLGQQPGLEVCWQAANGREALDRLGQADGLVDVVLIDLLMPVLDGASTIRQAADAGCPAVFVVLSAYSTVEQIRAAFTAGARGYLVKEDDPAEISAALERALAGELVFSPSCSRALVDSVVSGVRPGAGAAAGVLLQPLTARELEVLALVADSLSNDQIARSLGVSVNTVKVHMRSILQKLEVMDRAGAVAKAMRLGLIF